MPLNYSHVTAFEFTIAFKEISLSALLDEKVKRHVALFDTAGLIKEL